MDVRHAGHLQTGSDRLPRLLPWLALNPINGLIASFRASVLGQRVDLYSLGISGAISFLLLLSSFLYFRRVERAFADIIDVDPGLLITYVMTFGGVVASLFYPYAGLLVYVCLAS